MPTTSKDMERIILADGWVFKRQVGSHKQVSNDSAWLYL